MKLFVDYTFLCETLVRLQWCKYRTLMTMIYHADEGQDRKTKEIKVETG